MTPEQQALIERLYENESLTDNLTDADAQALLKWAEEQIRNETDGELVTAAVSNANQSGVPGVQALLTQASTFLIQELRAREANAARAHAAAHDTSAPTAPTLSDGDTQIQAGAAPTPLSALGIAGASRTETMLGDKGQASLASAQHQPVKKKRRATKRKKK